MPVVGVAEVLVRPSFKGFQAELGAAVDQTVPAQEKKGSKLGTALVKGLKTAAKVGVAGAGALLATSLTKGFGRLVAIENAQAKLRGLGHDAETVDKIMTNATASVKGTAFGLDEAATVAANAVAAGVKPGAELERTLKLVADASTIAGVDMGEMGAIFNKVAASNKVQMDVINQLHDAGVPALQLLANELGVTAEEASKMASKGEIDFATFQKAMETGLGGAAQESGKTLQGAFKNTMAALGRFGANLMGGIYPKVREFFQGAIEFMKPMEERAKVWGEAIGNAIVGFIDWIGEAIRVFKEWLPLISVATGALTGFFIAFGAYKAYKAYTAWLNGMTLATRLWTTAQKGLNLALLKSPFTWIAVAIGALVAAFIYAYNNVDWFREGVDTAMAAIGSAFRVAGEWIGSVFGGLINWIKNDVGPAVSRFAEDVGRWIGDVVQWFRDFGTAVGDVVGAVGKWFADVGNAVGSFFGGIINGIKIFIRYFNGIKAILFEGDFIGFEKSGFHEDSPIVGFLFKLRDGFIAVVDVIRNVVMGTFNAVAGFINGVLVPAFQFIGAVVGAVFKVVVDTIRWWWSVWKAIAELAVGVVRFVLGAAFTWLRDKVILPVWKAITTAIQAAWGFISSVFNAVVAFVSGALSRVFLFYRDRVILPVWRAVSTAVSNAWKFISGIFNSIVSFIRTSLSRTFTWLRDNIILPVWTAITTAIRNAWNWIRGIFNSIITFIRNSLSRTFTWLRDNVILPVWNGITGAIRNAWNWIRDIFNKMISFIRTTLANGFTFFRDRVVKPVFDGVVKLAEGLWKNVTNFLKRIGDFFTKNLPDMIRKGVGFIRDAWGKVGEFFAKPIRWVLRNVWDGGIKKAFDSVASAVGINTKLPKAPSLGFYAKGGKVKEEWYIAGENGPELIHRGSGSHRVYTAKQTRAMLAEGREDLPEDVAKFAVGSHPSQSLVPAGGGVMSAIGNGLNWLDDKILGGAGKKAISWIGGMLADGARQLLKPLVDGVKDAMSRYGSLGKLASGWLGNVVDGLFKWAEKKDEEAPVEGSTGEMFDGGPGGFRRPSSGRITSYYGPRWGRVHEGIDFAGGGLTRAAWNGIVQKVGWNLGPGRTGYGIQMNHGPGLWTYHGHNPVGGVRVRPGQKVKAGQVVGAEGTTGNVTGKHLHWEVHRGAPWRSVNPLALLRDNGGTVPPGVRLVANLSGRDELMLNHRDALRTAEALRSKGGGVPEYVAVRIGEREFKAYVEDIGDARLRQHVSGIGRIARQYHGSSGTPGSAGK